MIFVLVILVQLTPGAPPVGLESKAHYNGLTACEIAARTYAKMLAMRGINAMLECRPVGEAMA